MLIKNIKIRQDALKGICAETLLTVYRNIFSILLERCSQNEFLGVHQNHMEIAAVPSRAVGLAFASHI